MFHAITHFTIWVTDQDEALEFYVGKLGLEVTADVQLDFMRWITVGVPSAPGTNVILAPLSPPLMPEDDAATARELLSKGTLGSWILATDDCRAEYERLRALGVEFTEAPTEQPYGIDCAARDPFGNQVRISQRL